MNSKFANRLKEFLDSELEDYGMPYEWEWDEDYESCEVHVFGHGGNKCDVYFRYIKENDQLQLQMGEDIWENVGEYDWTVKYFWMMIAKYLF